MIKIIGNKAMSNMSFLSLEDQIFEKNMLVTYTAGTTIALSPSKQFDAIITYPEISIFENLTMIKNDVS